VAVSRATSSSASCCDLRRGVISVCHLSSLASPSPRRQPAGDAGQRRVGDAVGRAGVLALSFLVPAITVTLRRCRSPSPAGGEHQEARTTHPLLLV